MTAKLVKRSTKIVRFGISAEILEVFEKEILKEFKELLMLGDVKAVLWNEKMLVQKQVQIGNTGYINALPLGLCAGVAIGTALDNLALGICIGMLWGLAFGTIFTSREKK